MKKYYGHLSIGIFIFFVIILYFMYIYYKLDNEYSIAGYGLQHIDRNFKYKSDGKNYYIAKNPNINSYSVLSVVDNKGGNYGLLLDYHGVFTDIGEVTPRPFRNVPCSVIKEIEDMKITMSQEARIFIETNCGR
jgi:hypothetical protein